MRHILLASCLLLAMNNAVAQPWDQGGNSIFAPTDYLGCDGSSTFPLHLRTIPDLSIDFTTRDQLRMRLNADPFVTLGGSTYIASGNLGLCRDGSLWQSPNQGAATLFHMASRSTDASTMLGLRKWMDDLLTFTNEWDHASIGLRYYIDPQTLEKVWDRSDLVFHLSDNWSGNDGFSFRFTQDDQSAPSGRHSWDGQELMRLSTDGNVGIGDFQGDNSQITERFHVNEGLVRIEELPTNPEMTMANQFVVVDPSGVLGWRNAAPGGGCGSGWNLIGTTAVTAYNGNPCPPQAIDRLGVGTTLPQAKFHVIKNLPNDLQIERAIVGHIRTQASTNIGVHGLADGQMTSNNGVLGRADNAPRCTGVQGEAMSGSSTNWGLRGFGATGVLAYGAFVQGWGASNSNYGIWATASGPNAWAGWFQGDVNITNTLTVNGVVYPSDAALKTDVVAAPSCLPLIAQLAPKSYHFTSAASDALSLDGEQHVGLIAQELEQVIPTAVHQITVPAKYDTLGNELEAQWSYKGVDYVSLIPYLIGAVQELAVQNATLAAQLSECCTPAFGDADTKMSGIEEVERGGISSDRLLSIQPNPITDHTTVRYQLERGGRMMLMVNSSDGKQLQVLQEATQSEGEYRYEWTTGGLAPGIYYVTLLLDGEPLVKRAVKVAR